MAGLELTESSVGLTVNDLQKSIAWYEGALGFTQGERWEMDGVLRGIELKAGPVTLMLGQDDFKKGRDRKKGEGWRAYLMTSQDVDAIADRARKYGARLDEEPADSDWGARAFSLTDPDGFKITIARMTKK